ncbi:MAG: contractile injection system protein, VgrG/Pvc8 family, partial [bacterium]
EMKLKIDGQNIAGEYPEKDREEADIGSRVKTLRDTYFGDNIILRDKEKSFGEISGNLIYIYGSGKRDQLIIEGFQNGDYGISLVEKASEGNEEVPVTYISEYKIKFEPIEYAVLEKMEINRDINEHTTVHINGFIKDENKKDYVNYLEKKDPKIIVTYDGDDTKILFKGIIENYKLYNKDQKYKLEINARSYSVLMERERRSRIYQNKNTSYKDICSKLTAENEHFSISCADSSIGGTLIVTEDYPVLLQYKETDWDFLKRIASYINQPIIVDDTKDNSETISVQIGCHNSGVKELKNINFGYRLSTGRRNTKYKYGKVMRLRHKSIDEFFAIGSRVNCIINFESEEKKELFIIKTKTYIDKDHIFSDFVLAKKEDIQLFNVLRKYGIEGRSFRAEVKKVNNQYRAKVQLCDIDDDFEESGAYWFPVDRIYTEAFFAPEVGDTVDVYFKSENERYATIKSSTADSNIEIDNAPEDKTIITPENYQIKINNESVTVIGKDEKSTINIAKDQIVMATDLSSKENKLSVNKDMIRLTTKKAKFTLDSSSTKADMGGTKITINTSSINMS